MMTETPTMQQIEDFGVAVFGPSWWTPLAEAFLPYRPPPPESERGRREERNRAKHAVVRWLKFNRRPPPWASEALPYVVTTLVRRQIVELAAVERAAEEMAINVQDEHLVDVVSRV